MGGRYGTMQKEQVGGVGRRGLVEADGALLLKATSPMERRALGLVLGLTRKPWDSTATTAGLS